MNHTGCLHYLHLPSLSGKLNIIQLWKLQLPFQLSLQLVLENPGAHSQLSWLDLIWLGHAFVHDIAYWNLLEILSLWPWVASRPSLDDLGDWESFESTPEFCWICASCVDTANFQNCNSKQALLTPRLKTSKCINGQKVLHNLVHGGTSNAFCGVYYRSLLLCKVILLSLSTQAESASIWKQNLWFRPVSLFLFSCVHTEVRSTRLNFRGSGSIRDVVVHWMGDLDLAERHLRS